MQTKSILTPKEIAEHVARRLDKYKNLNRLEQFAMFMGMAQLFEFKLKNFYCSRYDLQLEKIEKWTLGRTATELEKKGLRPDYIVLLKSAIDYRNHIAHELLANEIMLRAILGGDTGRLEYKRLEQGMYSLEQAVFLFEWTEEHNAWE